MMVKSRDCKIVDIVKFFSKVKIMFNIKENIFVGVMVIFKLLFV